jgi:hypothetical protein
VDPAEHNMRHPLIVKLWEEYGAGRSMRRGATTEAPDAGIDGPTIDANIVWRNVEAAKEKTPRYSMPQRYTQVFPDLKHQLMFSFGTKGGFKISVLPYWC